VNETPPITPFDVLAPVYDADFTASPVARYLRDRVQRRLLMRFRPGDHVLELGCGTAEDAVQLAAHGVRVTATDASTGMLTSAAAKAADQPLLQTAVLDLDRLPNDFREPYAGVYANFGVLNCLSVWRPLAAWLADRLRPGAIAAFSLMSPLCAWESLWCAAHGDFTTAVRRWRGLSIFQPDGANRPVYVRYPTNRRLTADFAPHFRRVHVEGVGVFLPPTAMYPIVERRPAWLRRLIGLEDALGSWPPLSLLADHYWIEFERR